MNEILKLKAEIREKTKSLKELIEKRDANGTTTMKTEIEELRALLVIAEEEETRKLSDMQSKKTPAAGNQEVSEMRAIVKSIYHQELTQEERAAITSTGNSAVLPKQFIDDIQEIKKGYGSLREYCDVIKVTKNEGTIPVVDLDQNDMPVVVEGDNIIDGTLITTEIPFICNKNGLIMPLSSELVEDAEVEIENICRKNFAQIATRVENTKIIGIVSANATAVAGATGYKDLETAMDTALPDVRNGLVTLTNPAGFAYLKGLMDSNDRPLNLVTKMNGKYIFNEKELVVADGDILKKDAAKAQIFYSVNMIEAVKITPRKELTVARSTEAGFSDDTIRLRVLERSGVQKGIVRSIQKIEF